MIYFVQAIEIENAPIKIGYSEDVDRRLEQLEWNYRTPLALLATMPGGRDEEKAIHARFSHLRMGVSEQFRPARELFEFIERPLLASANPDASVAIRGQEHTILILKGTEEFARWLKNLANHVGLPVTNTIDHALKLLAEHVKFNEPMPRRQKR